MKDHDCIFVWVQLYFKARKMQNILEYISHDYCQGGKKSVSYLKNCVVMDYSLDRKNNHTELYNLQQAYFI